MQLSLNYPFHPFLSEALIYYSVHVLPGSVEQLVMRLTQELKSQRSRVRYPVQPHTFISPSTDSRRAVVSYWRKYVHKVLVNRLGGLRLPRLTDRRHMTTDVYDGRNTTQQQYVS